MSLYLCDVCQRLNIRELLSLSESQRSNSVQVSLNANQVESLELKPGLPNFFRHQSNLGAVETAAKLGCTLCNLIYECWSENPDRCPRVDKAIDDSGQGQLFIGTSGHFPSKGEMPVITVTQRLGDRSSRTLCTFDVTSERNSIARKASKFVGAVVSHHSDSDDCRATAMEWLQECITNHPKCGPSKPFRRPSRLIDVGNKDGNEPPRLELNGMPSTVSWAALSYCWGGDSQFTLRSDTVQDLIAGIPLAKWPATLRNAITITQDLGLQYIWIDALCILQDSATDWRVEASRMRDVYSGAIVTIIASESPSTNAGIYAPRPPSPWSTCELPFNRDKENHSKVWLRPSFRSSVHVSYSDPLQTRGWTLQEGLLAPRTLSFRKDQMMWECSNYRLTESGHITLLDHMFDSKDLFHNKSRKKKANLWYQDLWFGFVKQILVLERQKSRTGWFPRNMGSLDFGIQRSLQLNPYTRWSSIVSEYSRRNFTKDTDILPALGGIARAFADITKDKYCAGMWESELLQYLCWWRVGVLSDKKKLYEPSNMGSKRLTRYRAPSWSWAGINGSQVHMSIGTINLNVPIKNIASPVKIHLEALDGDLFGQLQSGFLDIKGSLFPLGDLWAEYWRNVSPSWEQYKLLPKSTKVNSETCEYPSLHDFALHKMNASGHNTFEFDQQHIPHPNQFFAAFLIAHTEGLNEFDKAIKTEPMKGDARLLLLESTGRRDAEYRRIGLIKMTRPWELGIVYPEADRTETSRWRDIEESEWERYENEIKWPAVEMLEAKAWVEVAKRPPRRTTIRII